MRAKPRFEAMPAQESSVRHRHLRPFPCRPEQGKNTGEQGRFGWSREHQRGSRENAGKVGAAPRETGKLRAAGPICANSSHSVTPAAQRV